MLSLYIAEVTISLSKDEYSVQESDGTAMVRILKDREVASPLGVILNTWTLQEASAQGCLLSVADSQGN